MNLNDNKAAELSLTHFNVCTVHPHILRCVMSVCISKQTSTGFAAH